jgi:hypothetical protein
VFVHDGSFHIREMAGISVLRDNLSRMDRGSSTAQAGGHGPIAHGATLDVK